MKLPVLTLGTQLLLLLLGALIVSQGITFLIYSDERAAAVRQADRLALLESTASVMRLLQAAAPGDRGKLAESASSRRMRFWTTAESPLPEGGVPPRGGIVGQFRQMLGGPPRDAPRLAFVDPDGNPVDEPPSRPQRFGREPPGPWWQPWRRERYDVLVSMPFSDGGWLNAQTRIRSDMIAWDWPSIVSTAVMALAILLIVALTTRRVVRPLRALAAGTEAFGRGAPTAPLEPAGPLEIRRLTTAFNHMQQRLTRFVADRTRMIAAIGHDLRTPITSLRLRAELLDDTEARDRMLTTLDEMQHMAEATLQFAREDAEPEPLRAVDLAALLETMADDQSDLGHEVAFAESPRLPYRCRPNALKRAVGNLVQNAVQYGKRARIALRNTPAGPVITIDDDGPGIPEDRLEDVFQPFVRLEGSRSRLTGGSGLGLSIARSIILGQGGDLTLRNRPGGGLQAEIRLPPSAAADPFQTGSTEKA